VNLVREARASYGGSLTAAMRDLAGWRRLVRKVARVVREMPFWRLQRIGAELNFLYEHQGDGGVIQLLPGHRVLSPTERFKLVCTKLKFCTHPKRPKTALANPDLELSQWEAHR
jgi:hypothetical protein